MSLNFAVSTPLEGRVAKILALLQNNMETREIAAVTKFKDVRDMAEYMRNKGYKWDADKSTYIYVGNMPPNIADEKKAIEDQRPSGNVSIEKHGNIIRFLEQHADKLEALLVESVEEVPRYILPGISRTKSFHLNHGLELLTKEFSIEKNVTQKDIIQVALVEFFKRYGYHNEIKRLTGR